MIDKIEFMKVMGTLAALYPRFQLTDATMEAYYGVLSDLPIDLIKAAALELGSQDSPWFPSAGQLRQAAFNLLEQQDGCLMAGEAWAEVERVCKENYYPRKLDEGYLGRGITVDLFSDPIVYAALMAVGGPDYRSKPEDTIHTTRARFMDSYKALKERQRQTRRMLPQVAATAARLSAGSRVAVLGTGENSSGGNHVS